MDGDRQRGIPGYGYGSAEIARSPLTLVDLDLLKQTVLFTERLSLAKSRSFSLRPARSGGSLPLAPLTSRTALDYI